MADISQFSMSFGIQRAVTILRILLLFSSILLLKGIVNRSYKLDVISTKDINLHNKKNSTHFFKRIFIKAWAFSSKEMCVILEDILEGHACVINPIFADVKAEYGQCINTIRTYSYKPKFIHQRNLTKQPTYSIIKLTIEIYNTEECIKMIQNIDKNKFMCVDLTGRRKIHLSKVKFVIVLRNGLLDFHRVFGSCIGFYRQNSCYGRMFMGSHSSSPQRRYTQSSVKNSSNTCRSFARLCISDSVFRNNSCLNYLCANASEIIWQKITFRSFEICNIVQVKQSYNENVSDPIINYKLVLTESGVIDKPRCDLQFTRGIKTMGGGGKMIVIDCNATRLARENTSQPSTNGEFSLLPRIKLKRQNRSSPVKISSLDMNNFNTKSAKEITMPTVTARSVAKMHDGLDLQMSESFSQHSFNVTVSDSLPLNRMIPDLAPKSCPRNFDLEGLPDASVVICFHNEAISALLRTVWSVLSRSPPSILKEIILVDDASTLESLGKPLAAAFANWTKVKLTRTFKREGLIRARLIGIRRFHAHGNKFKEQYFGQVDLIISAPNVIGANRASGDVLVFLDSHCECNQDWLQPLLHRIKNNKTTIACPEIDVIDPYTFQYIQTPENLHGYFTWNLDFAWKGIPFSKKHPEDPVSTPVMVGGIFAVEREYFFHMGSYDEQMEIWGGENLEISFRIWMCGGTIEILPCSRVGHVYRLRIPYLFPDGVRATVQRNKARVAGVWMDEFKMFYFASNGVSDPGDLWRRHSLRKNLRCHGFRWYLDNVIPELPVPSKDTLYFGEVRNELKLLCLEAGPNKGTKRRVTLEGCHGNMKYQYFSITTFGQMKLEDSCLEFETSDEGDLVLADCSGSEHQKWKIKGHSIINIVTRKCITAVKSIVRLQDCAHGENCKEQKRILLNDPAAIQQQMENFQREIQDLRATVNNVQQKLSALEANGGKGGTHFVRWGRKDCPGNFSLVFSGYAGGSYYTHTGAASEYVCLPPDPIYNVHKNYVPSYFGVMYGSEYEDTGFYGMKDLLEDVPCAVCYTPAYSTTLMISARTECYPGWTEAYHGDLSSGDYRQASATQYVCVDADPQALVGGGNVNDDGKLFYPVKGKCGSLRCPQYEEEKLLSCIVCLK